LWAGIAATIHAPSPTAQEDTKVIAFPTSHPSDELSDVRARASFSVPQLAAASVALIALSSMATWAGVGAGATGIPVEQALESRGSFVTAEADRAPELATELLDLQQALEGAWASLDANTVRVLDRNLAVIEQAIDDSVRALEQDPENEFLSEHLGRVFERKLTFLRDAAQLVEWAGE